MLIYEILPLKSSIQSESIIKVGTMPSVIAPDHDCSSLCNRPDPESNPRCFRCMLKVSRPSFEAVKEGWISDTGIFPDL